MREFTDVALLQFINFYSICRH